MKSVLHVVTLVGFLALGGVAVAQEGVRAQIKLDIAAQPLNDALNEFARQSGLQVFFLASRESKEMVSGALKGDFSPEAALTRLLEGTGLGFEYLDERTIAVKGKGALSGASGMRQERDVRLAQVGKVEDVDSEGRKDGKQQMEADDDSEEETREQGGIPEILVTGSKVGTLNMDIERTADDSQPYVVIDRETIENSPHGNLQELLKHTLTMTTGQSGPSQSASILGNTSSINLRGLGSDETLILVDGHRVAEINNTANAGVLQPDLNGIPLAAIERIEVLPTTASGLYGGGATGGVINIVLRRDFSGMDIKLTYGNTMDSDVATRRVDVTGGGALNEGRTRVLFSGSFSDANELLVQERDFAARSRAHILANNPGSFYEDVRPPLGSTPNIRSTNGAPLTLDPSYGGATLTSSITGQPTPISHIPVGCAGIQLGDPCIQGLISNAGQYNLELANTAQDNGGRLLQLLNSPVTASALLTLRQEITPSIQTFLDLGFLSNSGHVRRNTASFTGSIPASSPNNPFQQAIFVNIPTVGADGYLDTDSESRRAVVGLISSLPNEWRMVADFTWNKSGFSYESFGTLSSTTVGRIRTGELDVLRDPNVFPLEFGPLTMGLSSPEAHAVLKDTTLRLSGPLPLRLKGGRIGISTLLEHRQLLFGENVQRTSSGISMRPSQPQTVKSAYIESKLPIVSPENSVRAVHELELQIAVRRDDYRITVAERMTATDDPQAAARHTTELTSTDPTVGMRYEPTPGIMFRASYGTGFLPPSVTQLSPAPSSPILGFLGLVDPLRGNEPILSGDLLLGGSSGLRPEESVSESIGIVVAPRTMQKFRVSLDWSMTRKTDNIASVATFDQADLEKEAEIPGLIVRGPRPDGDPFSVGPVIALNGGLFNVARLRVTALDLAARYEFGGGQIGDFDVNVGATHLESLETQLTSTSDVVENAGVSNAFDAEGGGLKWRANASILWRRNAWTLGWAANYFDSYFVNSSRTFEADQGSATVPSQIYHDLFGSYRVRSPGLVGGLEVRFGVSNILKKSPPIDVATGFTNRYYSKWADPKLSSYYVSLRKSFGK